MTERRSPLEAAWKEEGAEFFHHRGCLVPERFAELSSECRTVRTTAGIIDRTDRAYLTATGTDAVRFLHGMVSNEIKALAPGQGVYATQLNPQGQMLADLYVLAVADHLLLEVDCLLQERLRGTLQKYIIADDVAIDDRSQQLTALSIQGPASDQLLTAAGAVVLPGKELNHTWVELRTPDRREPAAPVLVVRLSETGETGYRLICVVEYAHKLYDALAAQRTRVPWKPVGLAALNVLRTEAGIPWYGFDMDERTLPPEAGLEARALSYTKGCYLGQEIMERIRSRGQVNRRLTGLLLHTDSLPAPGANLTAEGKNVGSITTAVDSPALGRPIALGYVRREYLEVGTKLAVENGGTAEVATLPFYPPAR